MKRVEKCQMKETAIPGPAHFAQRKANGKNDPENLSRKCQAKSLKGPLSKYGQQSDVREKNHLLAAENEDLQRQISELKENVAGLEQRCDDLQDDNAEVNKQLRVCHMLLIAENLDPGEKIGDATEQKDKERNQMMTVSQKLLTELKLFDEFAKEHGTRLAEVQNTMRSLKEARDKLQADRESFCLDAEQMERALEEAEALLIENNTSP